MQDGEAYELTLSYRKIKDTPNGAIMAHINKDDSDEVKLEKTADAAIHCLRFLIVIEDYALQLIGREKWLEFWHDRNGMKRLFNETLSPVRKKEES